MYSRPADSLADSTVASEARDLISRCVHCGLCLPACPTYRLTGNELDSPRGRIYLVKELIESGVAHEATRRHLDRCLTCRACETACPSGVEYGRLADLGRELVEDAPPRPRGIGERALRAALLGVATRRRWFTPLVRTAQAMRRVLPKALRNQVPPRPVAARRPPTRHARRMAVLEGCVQPGLAPQVNVAAARVLDRLGVSLVPAREVGCCGAMEHHLGRTEAALARVRHNVLASVRLLDAGTEAIVSTASGCGAFARDYGHALRHASPELRALAARVGAATRDLSEVVAALLTVPAPVHPGEDRSEDSTDAPAHAGEVRGAASPRALRVAWQSPCSLQHGQRTSASGKVESILRAVGCELVPVLQPTLCCGSAGTYSLLQPELSRELRARKLETLLARAPDVIATANVGCLEHLRQVSPVPVRHWIEIVDERLATQDRQRRS